LVFECYSLVQPRMRNGLCTVSKFVDLVNNKLIDATLDEAALLTAQARAIGKGLRT